MAGRIHEELEFHTACEERPQILSMKNLISHSLRGTVADAIHEGFDFT